MCQRAIGSACGTVARCLTLGVGVPDLDDLDDD
jgi:hypothetical protein